MEEVVSYISLAALALIVFLLSWSLVLMRRERGKRTSAGSRLRYLRGKVEDLPDESDDDRLKKEAMYKELTLEYLENILGEVERLKAPVPVSPGDRKQNRKSKKRSSK